MDACAGAFREVLGDGGDCGGCGDNGGASGGVGGGGVDGSCSGGGGVVGSGSGGGNDGVFASAALKPDDLLLAAI